MFSNTKKDLFSILQVLQNILAGYKRAKMVILCIMGLCRFQVNFIFLYKKLFLFLSFKNKDSVLSNFISYQDFVSCFATKKK